MIPLKNTIAVLLLIVGSWFLMQNGSAVDGTPIKKSLELFPKTIGDWKFVNSSESSEDVIKMLGVDDDIQYTYRNSNGQLINLYVGYYGAVGVTGAYHSPKNCLPGGGWGINTVRDFPITTGIEGDDSSVISEMIIRNGSRYQVVLYWYQNRGRIIASEYWEKIYLILDALKLRRRDGTFVRIMLADHNDNLAETSTTAGKFAELVMDNLESFLPGKKI